MDTLRWIVLLLGLLLIGGLYGYYRWQSATKGKNRRRRSKARRRGTDPDVDRALRELDDLRIDAPADDLGDLDLQLGLDEGRERDPLLLDDPNETVSAPRVRSRSAAAQGERHGPTQPEFPGFDGAQRLADETYQDAGEKIVVLHVVAGRGYCFTGPALVAAAERLGLRYGAHAIFHQTMHTRGGPVAIYSMASMVEPGTFDLSRLDEMETPGVALFMRLPAPFDGLTVFEQMLETARRLADLLDGYVLDGQRCDLTQQSVEHIREELREYRRLARLAARKGGAQR